MSKKQVIIDTISDLCMDFLFYDRKNDEDLSFDEMEMTVIVGEITVDEMVAEFRKHLENQFNSRKTHLLKLKLEYWDDVESGAKNFEVRKNDRGFKVGDLVSFNSIDEDGHEGNVFMPAKKIKYILAGGQYGISDEYCVIGF